MDKTSLREAFIEQLWRMYKLEIMLYLRAFAYGAHQKTEKAVKKYGRRNFICVRKSYLCARSTRSSEERRSPYPDIMGDMMSQSAATAMIT